MSRARHAWLLAKVTACLLAAVVVAGFFLLRAGVRKLGMGVHRGIV